MLELDDLATDGDHPPLVFRDGDLLDADAFDGTSLDVP